MQFLNYERNKMEPELVDIYDLVESGMLQPNIMLPSIQSALNPVKKHSHILFLLKILQKKNLDKVLC